MIEKYLRSVFFIDLRSMALFRLFLGFFIIADLIVRSTSLEYFYTDVGVMPRFFVINEINHALHFSIFHIGGTKLIVTVLFILNAICAFFLAIGYKTRLFTFLCWVFMVSLINRAPALAYGVDSVLKVILFWGMFLPMGLYYSVDAAFNTNKIVAKKFFSAGTVGILFQIIILYISAGIHKSDSQWFPDGTAMAYALQLEPLITPIGQYFKKLPDFLLMMVTFGTVFMERFLPFFLLVPVAVSYFRLTLVFVFFSFHLGIALAMFVGGLSWICMIAWILFLPSLFWNYIEKKISTTKGKGITIFYNDQKSCCKSGVLLIQQFLGLSKLKIVPGSSNQMIGEIIGGGRCFVVRNTDGNVFTSMDAFKLLLRESFLKKLLVPIFNSRAVEFVVIKIYKAICNSQYIANLFCNKIKIVDKEYKPMRTTKWLVAGFAAYILCYNIWGYSGYEKYKSPKIMNPIREFLRIDQKWILIAPKPYSENGWFIIDGYTNDGKHVNLWNTDFKDPFKKPANLPKIYISERWSKYLRMLLWVDKYSPYFGRYLCKEFDKGVKKNKELNNIKITYIFYKTTIDGSQNPIQERVILKDSCAVLYAL